MNLLVRSRNGRRSLIVAAAIGTCGLANALVDIYLAYGDPTLVQLARSNVLGSIRDPNAVLGGRIPEDRALLLPQIGAPFTLDIRMKVVSTDSGSSPLRSSSGVVFLGFDRDNPPPNAKYSDLDAFTAAQDDHMLSIGGITVSSSIGNLGQGFPGEISGTPGLVNMQIQGAPYLSGRYSATAEQRSIGITFPYIYGLANSLLAPVGTDVRLCSVMLKNIGIASSATYGSAGTETGLCLYASSDAVTRANFLACFPREFGYPTRTKTIAVQGTNFAAINQPPKFDPPPTLSTAEEASVSLQLTATDDDKPEHYLLFSLPTPVAGASVTPDGLLTYLAPEGTGGTTQNITVRVSDYFGAFDEAIVKVAVTKRIKHIQGSILLQDYLGNTSTETANFQIFKVPEQTLVTTRFGVPLKPDGSFDLTWVTNEIPAGSYRIWVKTSHWLSESASVYVSPTGVSGLNFSLRNGDVDGDNEVTIFDYSLLSDAFDGRLDDPTYLGSADLDGDGWITVFDYSILSLNFDQKGH